MPATPRRESTLDQITIACTARGAAKFRDALGVVVDRYRDVRVDVLPSDLLMLLVGSMFLLDLEFWKKERSGLTRFLSDQQHKLGRYLPQLAEFAAAIGAPRAAAQIERSIARFPGGLLPNDPKSILVALVPLMNARPNPLAIIEGDHADALRELTGALQRWLRANPAAVAAAIDALVSPRSGNAVSSTPNANAKSSPSALEAILANAGAAATNADPEILERLAEWAMAVPGRKAIPFADVPEGARMLALFDEFATYIGAGGLRNFADCSIGDEHAALRKWAVAIGAERTIAYLDAFAALFPRGRVPRDKDERSDALERRAKRDAKKGLDPIQAVDRTYQGDVERELPMRVRDYVRFNLQRFEQESRAAAAQPPGSSPDDLLLDVRDWITFHREMRTRLGADVRLDELPEEERARVGDVMEVKAGRGFAYYQVTHRHQFWGVAGPVMRAIQGVVRSRIDGDALADHVRGPTAFVALIAIDRARGEGKAKLVARNLPVPEANAAFPHFLFHWGKTRDGRNVWGEWVGGDSAVGQIVGPLDPAMFVHPVANDRPDYESLGEAVRDGWSTIRSYKRWGEPRA